MPFAKCIAAGYVLFCVPKENQKGRRCPQGMKAPVGLLSRRPVCAANAACSARQGLRYFRGAGGGGLRLPASASCLGRHSHSAGRCPNSSSLHSLFCRYATSSPGRGKSLAAGRGRRRCPKRGQGACTPYPRIIVVLFLKRPGGQSRFFSLAAAASRIIFTQVSRPRAALMARS